MIEEKTQGMPGNTVEIAPIGKIGDGMMRAIDGGGMVAMLCGEEILYAFVGDGQYQCFIHSIGGSNGRRRAYPMDRTNRAMLQNFAGTADRLFEIAYPKDMQPMGVMYTAEKAIVELLRSADQTPECTE